MSARDRGIPEAESVDLFLHATRSGLFDMSWDVVCPQSGMVLDSFGALRTLKPDSVVCTEPESAQGHAISAERLASIYGPGAHAERPAGAALEAAKGLAGASGNVLVCGSLYLVGEVLSLRDQRAKI